MKVYSIEDLPGKTGDLMQDAASGYALEARIETAPDKVNHSSAAAIYAVEKLNTHGVDGKQYNHRNCD